MDSNKQENILIKIFQQNNWKSTGQWKLKR